MTRNLAPVRQILSDRLQVLKLRLYEIDAFLATHEEDDSEERAAETAGDEVLENLGNTNLREISEIYAALERIDKGSYGRCTECGDQVDPRRLAILPHVARCIACESLN